MCLQSHCGGLPRRHFNLGGAPDFIHVKFVLVAVGFDPSVVDDMFLAVDAVRVSALPYSSLRPTALYLLSGLQANNLRESSLQTEISEWAPKALTGPHGGSPSLQKVHAFVPERRTAFEAFCGSIRTERVDPDYLRSQIDSVRSNTRIGMKHRCAIELSQFSMQSNALSSAPALALSDGIVVNADTAEQQWTAPQRLQEQNIPILTVNKSRVVDPHKVYYLPKLGVAICICPKCGSTALFYFIYRVLIGQSWPYPKRSKPFVQNIMSRRWKGMWQALRPGDEQLLRYRIAFTRDPRERLVSAYLDKYACNQSQNKQERLHHFTRALLELEGRHRYLSFPACLPLDLFSTVLGNIRTSGMALEADPHVRGQSEMCFREHPPAWWDWVGSLGAPEAGHKLATALLDPFAAAHLTQTHCHSINCTTKTSGGNLSMLVKDHSGGSIGWSAELERWVQPDLKLLAPFLATSRICRAHANHQFHANISYTATPL